MEAHWAKWLITEHRYKRERHRLASFCKQPTRKWQDGWLPQFLFILRSPNLGIGRYVRRKKIKPDLKKWQHNDYSNIFFQSTPMNQTNAHITAKYNHYVTFATKRAGVRGPRSEFSLISAGPIFAPTGYKIFTKNQPKRVAGYEHFTNITKREWLKTKK